jgi:hypothetical protein
MSSQQSPKIEPLFASYDTTEMQMQSPALKHLSTRLSKTDDPIATEGPTKEDMQSPTLKRLSSRLSKPDPPAVPSALSKNTTNQPSTTQSPISSPRISTKVSNPDPPAITSPAQTVKTDTIPTQNVPITEAPASGGAKLSRRISIVQQRRDFFETSIQKQRPQTVIIAEEKPAPVTPITIRRGMSISGKSTATSANGTALRHTMNPYKPPERTHDFVKRRHEQFLQPDDADNVAPSSENIASTNNR